MNVDHTSQALLDHRRGEGSLWRHRNFLRLWAGQSASQFGAQTCLLTLPMVAVVSLGVGSGQLGLLRAVQQIPIFLFALLAGVWVDRWRGRDVMVLADLGRALALALLPLSFALGLLGMRTLYAVAFVVGVCTVFFDVAYQAYLLRLVGREQLVQGNSMLESTRSAAQIGGPALGGTLVSVFTAPIAVAASTFFFAFSALSIRSIREPGRAAVARHHEGVIQQVRAGLRLVTRDGVLRAIAVVSCVFNLAFAAFMTVYLLYLPRELGMSGAAVGLCLAALGPGALAGSLVAGSAPRRLDYGPVLVACSVLPTCSCSALRRCTARRWPPWWPFSSSISCSAHSPR